jgi:pimeloyl-ACP methyl ester carboxylesterase
MAVTKTIEVPHLGGIKAGYALSGDSYDALKPTCVLINSMCTTVSLYRDQFSDKKLTDAMNLLAIEPLGHGATSTASEHFTYWDSAIMALQVMDALGIKKAFALGTSQGGWMVVRMALLAPEKVLPTPHLSPLQFMQDFFLSVLPANKLIPQILGLMTLGTTMDYESVDSRTKGCWDPAPILTPFYEKWTSTTATPEFIVDDVWCGMVGSLGFGTGVTTETIDFWKNTLKDVYKGDEGRKKVRMAVICLLERDGLLLRLGSITCPVYWLQVSSASPFSGD